jgi:hypothetical protein
MDEHWGIWTLVPSGVSIVDWIPAREVEVHDLGRKCSCTPEKVLVRNGPHVTGVRFLHNVTVRA